MEDKSWKRFQETGKVIDYLGYRQCVEAQDNQEREDTGESDYSDRDGASGIANR